VLRGAEGIRVRQGDILQSSDLAFVQIEFRGGTVTALGASSGLFLHSNAGTRGSGTEIPAAVQAQRAP
jgi:hypothetical protein